MDDFCGVSLPPLANAANQWWQPHGHCVIWDPWITWTWTICDLSIWACYMAIPCLLLWHLRGTRLGPLLPWVAPFVLACGMGHLWDAAAVWWPWYALVTASRVITAVISLLSVAGLAWFLPSLRDSDEVNLLSSQQEGQVFVDGLAEAAFVSSKDGGNLAVNALFRDLLGVGLEETRGYGWAQPIVHEDRDRYVTRWLDFVEGRRERYREKIRWRRPDGEVIYVETRGGRRSSGQFYGTVRLVSEAEQQLERLE